MHLRKVGEAEDQPFSINFKGLRYEIGQFEPRELKRVKRLALSEGGPLLYPWRESEEWIRPYAIFWKMFWNVSELLFVEWEATDIHRWRGLGKHWIETLSDTEGESGGEREQYFCCIAMDEMKDLLSALVPDENHRAEVSTFRLITEILKAYEQRENTDMGDFEHQRSTFKETLVEARGRDTNPTWTHSWKTPKIRAVHILPPSSAEMRMHEGQDAHARLRKEQEDWIEAQCVGSHVRVLEIPNSPVLSWIQYEEDGNNHTAFCIYSKDQMGEEVLYRGVCRGRKWWAQKEKVAPAFEICID